MLEGFLKLSVYVQLANFILMQAWCFLWFIMVLHLMHQRLLKCLKYVQIVILATDR